MADAREQVRETLLDTLLKKIEDDTYPSITMMDMAEELLRPDDLERYTKILVSKITDEQYPSVSMLGRLQNLATG
jgi:hypothetical protein